MLSHVHISDLCVWWHIFFTTYDVAMGAVSHQVKVLDMLNHPNIVAYIDSFVQDKALMIVMEYAEGGTVRCTCPWQQWRSSLRARCVDYWFFFDYFCLRWLSLRQRSANISSHLLLISSALPPARC